MSEKPKRITQSTILSMGWTKSMIDKLLPEPELVPNPHYRSAGSPMKLWHESAVLAAMETPEYAAAKAKYDKRKASAQKAVATKVERILTKQQELAEHITVKVIDDANLRNLTLDWHWDRELRRADRDVDYIPELDHVDESTMERWIVNHIRHNLTLYDNALIEFEGKTGGHIAALDMKLAVLDKIAAAYPRYAEECRRQQEYARCHQ